MPLAAQAPPQHPPLIPAGHSPEAGRIGPFNYQKVDEIEYKGETRRTYKVWTEPEPRIPALGPFLVDDQTFFQSAVDRSPEDALSVMNSQAQAMGQFLQFTARTNFVPPSQSATDTLSNTLPLKVASVELQADPLMPGYARASWQDGTGATEQKSIAYRVVQRILGNETLTEEQKATNLKETNPVVPEPVREVFRSLSDEEFLARCWEQSSMAQHPMVRMGAMARVLGDVPYDRILSAMGKSTAPLEIEALARKRSPLRAPPTTLTEGDASSPSIPESTAPTSKWVFRLLGLLIFVLVAGWAGWMTFRSDPHSRT